MNKDKVLGKAVTRGYVWSLEEHIRAFRGEQDHFEHHSEATQHARKRPRLSSNQNDLKDQFALPISSKSPSPSLTQQSSRLTSSEGRLSSPSLREDNEDSVRDTMDKLFTTTFEEGNATCVSDNLDRQIRQYSTPSSRRSAREINIEKENMANARLGQDFLKQGRRNNLRNRITDITAYDYDLVTRLAKRYFKWMNSAHPVLHECMFHLQLERYRKNPKEAALIDRFQVNMVIAIALASIRRPHLSISEIGRIAHDFWISATELRVRVLFGYGIEKLQNILLLLQYTLLVPKAGNLWQLAGLAIRFATEMGLYAEPNPSQDFDPLSLDLRRRIFWTCYCIDRILSTVMGRPIGIPDSWISAKCPSLVEDRLVTVHGILPGPQCYLKVAQIQQIRIYRLQSEIHQYLYAPSNLKKLPQEDISTWTWQMYDQLRLWRSSFCLPTPLITKEWTELEFHIAVVLLFRPSPNRTKLSNEALHVAFHSAGEVMKLVKTMHRELSAVFSWLTVQNLFMCGLTFVNSLKELVERRNSHQLCISFVEIFLQIQSCTAMLETLSALEAGANERIRNAFEMISSNVLKYITSIAPSLPQYDSHERCIWSQIAKLDNLSISRPTQIQNTSIPVQEYSTVLQETDIQGQESCCNGYDNKHYSEHDIDASTSNYMLEIPIDTDAYTVKGGRPPNNLVSSDQTFNVSSDKNQAPQTLDYQLNQETSGFINSTPSVATFEDPAMDRLAVISNVAAEAEPFRDLDTVPDWSESNLGAELERWFLYPLLEANEQFFPFKMFGH